MTAATDRSIPWATTVQIARIAVAFCLTLALFFAIRNYHDDECLSFLPPTEPTLLYLNLAFALSFTWLLAELAYVGLSFVSDSDSSTRVLLALLLGIGIYCAIGMVVWATNPTDPTYTDLQAERRNWNSGFWTLGILQETNNYGLECGSD